MYPSGAGLIEGLADREVKGSHVCLGKVILVTRRKDWGKGGAGGVGSCRRLFQAMQRYSGGGHGMQVNVGNAGGKGFWFRL